MSSLEIILYLCAITPHTPRRPLLYRRSTAGTMAENKQIVNHAGRIHQELICHCCAGIGRAEGVSSCARVYGGSQFGDTSNTNTDYQWVSKKFTLTNGRTNGRTKCRTNVSRKSQKSHGRSQKFHGLSEKFRGLS